MTTITMVLFSLLFLPTTLAAGRRIGTPAVTSLGEDKQPAMAVSVARDIFDELRSDGSLLFNRELQGGGRLLKSGDILVELDIDGSLLVADDNRPETRRMSKNKKDQKKTKDEEDVKKDRKAEKGGGSKNKTGGGGKNKNTVVDHSNSYDPMKNVNEASCSCKYTVNDQGTLEAVDGGCSCNRANGTEGEGAEASEGQSSSENQSSSGNNGGGNGGSFCGHDANGNRIKMGVKVMDGSVIYYCKNSST